MSLSRIWNGRPAGLPAALFTLLGSLVMRLADRLSTLLWRRNLGACGPGCFILWKPIIRDPARVRLGRGVILARGVNLSAEIRSGTLEIEDDVWVGEQTRIDFSGSVSIGAGTTLSPGVQIFTHSHGRDPRSKPEGYALRIGRGCWIGSGAMILQNVRELPDGCIIGAGAVVTRRPQAGEILGGNPARVIARSTPAPPQA
jgi:acetyltransferase-like isoleucine patch superfamily enzyme